MCAIAPQQPVGSEVVRVASTRNLYFLLGELHNNRNEFCPNILKFAASDIFEASN